MEKSLQKTSKGLCSQSKRWKSSQYFQFLRNHSTNDKKVERDFNLSCQWTFQQSLDDKANFSLQFSTFSPFNKVLFPAFRLIRFHSSEKTVERLSLFESEVCDNDKWRTGNQTILLCLKISYENDICHLHSTPADERTIVAVSCHLLFFHSRHFDVCLATKIVHWQNWASDPIRLLSQLFEQSKIGFEWNRKARWVD